MKIARGDKNDGGRKWIEAKPTAAETSYEKLGSRYRLRSVRGRESYRTHHARASITLR